jgi:hypothetical protein
MDQKILRNILLWKKEYGNVYSINICGIQYIYRSLSKGEFAALLAVSERNVSMDLDDVIFSECLLYPDYSSGMFDNDKAGGPHALYQAITNTIGFSVTDKFIDDVEKSRTSLGNLENQIVILVCKAFPHLTLSDIDNLTYDELLRYLTISEAILDVKINIEKPSSTKPGTIDFDQENKVMDQPIPIDPKKRSKRGDVSK